MIFLQTRSPIEYRTGRVISLAPLRMTNRFRRARPTPVSCSSAIPRGWLAAILIPLVFVVHVPAQEISATQLWQGNDGAVALSFAASEPLASYAPTALAVDLEGRIQIVGGYRAEADLLPVPEALIFDLDAVLEHPESLQQGIESRTYRSLEAAAFPFPSFGVLRAISDNGRWVGGSSENIQGQFEATVWAVDAPDTPIGLGPPVSFGRNDVWDLTDTGVAIGTDSAGHAFRGMPATELAPPSGTPTNVDVSLAATGSSSQGMRFVGEVTLQDHLLNEASHWAVQWIGDDPTARMLPTAPGAIGSRARAVSPNGRYVVGSVELTSLRPMIWDEALPEAISSAGMTDPEFDGEARAVTDDAFWVGARTNGPALDPDDRALLMIGSEAYDMRSWLATEHGLHDLPALPAAIDVVATPDFYHILIGDGLAAYVRVPRASETWGDLDHDRTLDVDDVDLLNAAIHHAAFSSAFDLNRDALIDAGDREYWVHQLKATFFGDANLDGEFNSSDLIEVLQAGFYEQPTPSQISWSTGDWNGDAIFDSGDLVLAFQDQGYEQGPRSEMFVPEPPMHALPWAISLLVLTARRRAK